MSKLSPVQRAYVGVSTLIGLIAGLLIASGMGSPSIWSALVVVLITVDCGGTAYVVTKLGPL